MSTRTQESYGQHGLTFVDRLGVWLSQRAIRRFLPKQEGLEILELGCGYRATQLLALGPLLKRGIGIDFRIAPELRTLDKFALHEGTIEEMLPNLRGESLDAVMIISVLEHLADPRFALHASGRSMRLEPIKPAPPVTTMFIGLAVCQ
jgi:2-polyprenyl-3-methyl-5-hydroxy-6-metoxy-1,4-benzoquinol methylase